jgi:ABC-type bacteriocin/lantibiotic exporter with double-glycine peptidase domain
MLLHRSGVTATEQEMALLCATRAGMGGTSECGVLRGLRRKLGDRAPVRIVTPPYESIPAPSIVSIRVSWMVSHAMMVDGVEADRIRLLDPSSGPRTMSRADFEAAWIGTAIDVGP